MMDNTVFDILVYVFDHYLFEELPVSAERADIARDLEIAGFRGANVERALDWLADLASERERPRTAQSFCVPKGDIAAQGYDHSLNRYKEVAHEEIEHRAPKDILADLARLEAEIQHGMKELGEMLK